MPPSEHRKRSYCLFCVISILTIFILLLVSPMNDIAKGVIGTLAAEIILILLIWAGNSLRKKIFPPRMRLCEIMFNNWSKHGGKYITQVGILNIPFKPMQTISVYFTSLEPKHISEIRIQFGRQIGNISKWQQIIINRIIDHRVWTWPSLFSFGVRGRPTLAVDDTQPEIQQANVYLLSNKVDTRNEINGDEYVIYFDEPVTIPAGAIRGGDPAMQIDFELISSAEWKGIIQCSSRINRVDQFAIAKVDISLKYGVRE